MATNQEVYGSAVNWVPVETYTGTERQYMWLKAYFGEPVYAPGQTTDYTSSCLGTGLYYGILPHGKEFTLGKYDVCYIDDPIDSSLSYCGLGNVSTYSNIEYYAKRLKDLPLLLDSDNRTVTDFTFVHQGQHSGVMGYTDSGNERSGSRGRWSPYGLINGVQNFGYSLYTNYNERIEPVTSIPMRNCVMVPYVIAADTIPENALVSSMDIRNLPWWRYTGNQGSDNQFTYRNHPYILCIYMVPYSTTNVGNVYRGDDATIDWITGVPQTDRSAIPSTQLNAVSVLNPLMYTNNQPVDSGSSSSASLSDSYSYALTTMWNSDINGIPIFGRTGSGWGADYTSWLAGVPDTDNAYPLKQHGMDVVLPHNLATWQFLDYTIPNTTNHRYAAAYYLEYYDGLIDWVRAQIACFGLFFTEDEEVARRGALNDEKMMLGTLVNGVGNGAWTAGKDNENQPQWQWTTTNDSEYHPGSNKQPLGPSGNDRHWTFNHVSVGDSTVKKYVLNDAYLKTFGQELWNVIDTTNPDELIQNQTLTNFLTNNPLDCVVGIKKFPLANMAQGSLVNIVLGKISLNSAAYPFTSDTTTLSCGTALGIDPIFKAPDNATDKSGTWIDWKNYLCEYILYLPFCGTIKLDPEVIINRNLDIKYSIDYTTGTCNAWIGTWTDGNNPRYIPIDSASGNCSIDIPLSGVQTATLNGEIYNANENLKSFKFNSLINMAKQGAGFAMGIKSGDVGSAASNALDLGANIVNTVHQSNQAEWNINNTQIPLKMIGASSGCNAFTGETYPFLLCISPEVEAGFNEAEYAHSVGFACCETGTIGSYSGYIQATNVDLSGFNATVAEKQMIKELLLGGVYVG